MDRPQHSLGEAFETAADNGPQQPQQQQNQYPQHNPPPPRMALPLDPIPNQAQAPSQFPVTSPFPLGDDTNNGQFVVSVNNPLKRGQDRDISYQINIYDTDPSAALPRSSSMISGEQLELIGIGSIYPVEFPIRTSVFRTWQSFNLFQQLLTYYFPFCIIPPLPKPRDPTQPTPNEGDDEHHGNNKSKNQSTSSQHPMIKESKDGGLITGSGTTTRSTTLYSNQAQHCTEGNVIFTGYLHIFLSRISKHHLLSTSAIFIEFITNPDEKELLVRFREDFNAIKGGFSSVKQFDAFISEQSQGLLNSLNFFPRDIYTTIQTHLDKNIVPPNYLRCRSSVWNLCSTTLESSQGLRASQQKGTAGAPTTPSFVISSPTGGTGTGTAPSKLTTLNSPENKAKSVTMIANAADAVALATDNSAAPPKDIVLGDVRSEEDGLRVESYLNALSTKLVSLSQVLSNFDNQQSIMANSMGTLGGAILQWGRFELFHHEDVRSILDSFAIALSRPYVETTPGPIRTQIIDYIVDLTKQTESVKALLEWRFSLSAVVNSFNKSIADNTTKINSLREGKGDVGTETEIEKLNAINRTIIQDRSSQQRYVDLMHAYLMIEIAWWRRVRRDEISKCVKTYAFAMKNVCQDRVMMWKNVELDIGQQLASLTTTRPFETRK